jgi:hypothetical protein
MFIKKVKIICKTFQFSLNYSFLLALLRRNGKSGSEKVVYLYSNLVKKKNADPDLVDDVNVDKTGLDPNAFFLVHKPNIVNWIQGGG